MKRGLILILFAVLLFSIYSSNVLARECAAGEVASAYNLCTPPIGASGPVSGSGSATTGSSETFTPSDEGIMDPSGSTAQTEAKGIAMDSQVSSEVERLYGTSAYAQAKKLYDDSVDANWDDFDSVSDQIRNMNDYDAIDSLKRAYNIRAINRLNQVWNEIMALEELYAEELNEDALNDGAQKAKDLANQKAQQQVQTSNNPFQSMIDFNFNFQPMTMTLSQSQINILGGLPPAKIHDLFNSGRNTAIQNNPSLSTLSSANFQKSPLANKLNKENPDTASKLQKSISLPSQNLGNFMKQQAQALLGV